MLVSIGLLAAALAAQQPDPTTVAAWLAGCWELRAGARVTVEMWMAPSGGLMLGASRTTVSGRAREFEQLQLSARGDTLLYIASPSGQATTTFRSVSVSPQQLRFENRQHDFPQVIIYRRISADSIHARIEGPGPNNTTRGIDFRYKRVDCATPPAPAQVDSVIIDADEAPDGRLLLNKGFGGNWDLFLIQGTSALRLTADTAVDYMPAWSPDGSHIAFVSTRDGHQEIYTMRADGSQQTRLTHGSAHNSEPAWSPDGRLITFQSRRDGPRPRLYLMNADGSQQRLLPIDSAAAAPSWSPDGKKIAFSSARNGRSEVYVIDIDGSGETRLTTSPSGHSGLPMWSPDGKLIAFWTSRDGNDEVYVMNADGSGVRNLSNHAARDLLAGWSRDSQSVFVRSTRDRPMNEIYRIKVDGSSVTRVTTTR